jgi:hypothetical protein
VTTLPGDHFPLTPTWFQAAVADAIERAEVTASKWAVPLEAIGRYESNYGPIANFCDVDTTLPVGIMQVSRSMLKNARDLYPDIHVGLGGWADPVRQVLCAILHIDSRLTVTGGYGGIGQVDGKVGLLPRTDRGPGNVLRTWLQDPASFDVEAARSEYNGY